MHNARHRRRLRGRTCTYIYIRMRAMHKRAPISPPPLASLLSLVTRVAGTYIHTRVYPRIVNYAVEVLNLPR